MGQMNLDEMNDLFADSVSVVGEPHLACVLLLDTSGSMRMTGAINKLNEALVQFKEQVCEDEDARNRVDVAIVTFGAKASVVSDFAPISQLNVSPLQAQGNTPMAAGINLALDIIKERNNLYNTLGTPHFPAWIFMITDGAPSDSNEMKQAAERVRKESERSSSNKIKFWALGVEGYQKNYLFDLTDQVFELTEYNFTGVFDWLSDSMTTIANSTVGCEPTFGDDVIPDTLRVNK